MIIIQIVRLLLRWLPWALVILGLYLLFKQTSGWFSGEDDGPREVVTHAVVLKEIENLGKLELVRYNFKEITELNEKNKPYLFLFDVPDSRVVVISHGEATGCIDLSKIQARDISEQGDSVWIRLPPPEMCYYKLDMENTTIYSIEKQVYYKKETELAQKALRLAERQMRDAALNSGILEQTRKNAETMLKPLLENISGKTIFFTDQLPEEVPVERR